MTLVLHDCPPFLALRRTWKPGHPQAIARLHQDVDGETWWAEGAMYDYATIITYCPFCGERL